MEEISLVAQWLRHHTSKAGGHRFIPWSGNYDPICHACGTDKGKFLNFKINNMKDRKMTEGGSRILL